MIILCSYFNDYNFDKILNVNETQKGIGKFDKLHVIHHNFAH